MLQFLAIISLINQLLPLIKQTVLALEDMFPNGVGADKKALLNSVLNGAVSGSAELQTTLQAAQPALQVVINGVVALAKVKAAV